MRFIVDLYRYIIFGFCGIAVIGLVLLALAAIDPTGPLHGGTALPVVLGGLAAAIFLVLNIGGLAIIVSFHDRHAELVDAALEIVTGLEQIASRLNDLNHSRAPQP